MYDPISMRYAYEHTSLLLFPCHDVLSCFIDFLRQNRTQHTQLRTILRNTGDESNAVPRVICTMVVYHIPVAFEHLVLLDG